ncbi:calcium-binding tyrosine phosphorylation-regulated protein-like isoform X3 [Sardina pilchardus]|uniref:calcium-binding tyrosine phosphorylation-regulated protein-like isoform X3 n=1 Tax=Sardina pilchardus TaxID=27697 RepID=UPI002E121362
MLKQHANVVPNDLPTLLEGFSKAALKKRPSNLGLFAWYYFTELMKYKTENEAFDLRKLVREFHKNMADRISGDGFEEELKKEGYKVTSNVDHEYNELCITGEVDLLSWGHRCDDTNNKNGPKSNAPPTARPNSSVKSNNSGRAAGDTKQKVHPEGNQKPRAEPSCLAEQFKIIKGIDASAQSKMLNALLVKEANLITQVQSQVKSVPLCPTSSLPIQKATDMRTRPPEAPKKATNPGSKGTTTTYACVHPLRDPPMNHINTSAQHEVKPSACSTTMAAQTNPSGTTTDAATEHLSAQLRDSSLGASDGPTEDRKSFSYRSSMQRWIQKIVRRQLDKDSSN